MPARDALHNVVKEALIKQGWRISQDPSLITFGFRKVFADIVSIALQEIVEWTS